MDAAISAGFDGSLFSYHPVGMALGFGVLLPAAMTFMRKKESAKDVEQRCAVPSCWCSTACWFARYCVVLAGMHEAAGT